MSKAYRISKDNFAGFAGEIKPLTTDTAIAAALRSAISPQPNGDMIVYITNNDVFADIVRKYGEAV